jgi:tetratricopeptide (TPR) repeat protein
MTKAAGERPRPSNKDEAWLVANTLIAAEEFEVAIESLSQVLEFDDQDSEAYYNRGLLLNELGRNDEALVDLSRAIELKSDVADYWARRCVAHAEMGDDEAALADISRARQLEDRPEYREAEEEIVKALETDQE